MLRVPPASAGTTARASSASRGGREQA